jgi:hypothetical protein
MKNVSEDVAEKYNTHSLRLITFSPLKIVFLWDNAENYGRFRQATDDNTI